MRLAILLSLLATAVTVLGKGSVRGPCRTFKCVDRRSLTAKALGQAENVQQTTTTTTRVPAANDTAAAINDTTLAPATTAEVHNTKKKGIFNSLFPWFFGPNYYYPVYTTPKTPKATQTPKPGSQGYYSASYRSDAMQFDVAATMGVVCGGAVGVAVVVGMLAL